MQKKKKDKKEKKRKHHMPNAQIRYAKINNHFSKEINILFLSL